MSKIRSKDTRPEISVRQLIYRLGYRYRLNLEHLPGKPDIVFSRLNKVIFVNGCFWHGHPDPNCKLTRIPKMRVPFWKSNLEGNYQRDIAKQQELRKLGWDILVIWECQLRNMIILESSIQDFLKQ